MRHLRTILVAAIVLASSTAYAEKIHDEDGSIVDFSDGSITVGVEVPGGAALATAALQTSGNAILATSDASLLATTAPRHMEFPLVVPAQSIVMFMGKTGAGSGDVSAMMDGHYH